MKIVYVLCLVFVGCATTTPYEIKNNVPFNQIEFNRATAVGIAIYNDSINGLKQVIEADCARFAGKPMTFYDLSEEMSLVDNQTGISNPGHLNQKYGDIKYIIAVVEYQSNIRKDYYTQETGSYSLPTRTRVSVFLETTMEIPCDIMLFQLPEGQLIAKAKKTFSETNTATSGIWLPEILADFEIESSDSRYPEVQNVSADRAANYFYNFLKDIDIH